jgi:hypothetical protein
MITVLAFIPAIAIGWLVVLILWPSPYRQDWLLKMSIALAVGLGIVSCLYFAWNLYLRPRSKAYFLVEFLILCALLFLTWKQRNEKKTQPLLFSSQNLLNRFDRIFLGVFFLALLIAGVNFVLQTLMQQHGIQDAWNIWNMRARFIFRGGPGWTDIFSQKLYWLNHSDYPFLVTAGTARAWSFIGNETTLAPAIQAALYALSLVGLIFSAVRAKSGFRQGVISALILVCTPFFARLAGWQIADVPLALFFTASVFLFILIIENPQQHGLFVLFGLCVGLAAWTKNEGISWLILCLSVFILTRLVEHKPIRIILRESRSIGIGLAIPVAVLIVLKIFLAPAGDLFSDQTTNSILEKIMDPQRYILTISYGIKALAGYSPIGLFVLPTIPILLVYLFIFFPQKEDRSRLRLLIFPVVVVLIQGLMYLAIYVITPHDLIWHLRTAVDRLIFHVTAPILLLIFLATRPPFDHSSDSSKKHQH